MSRWSASMAGTPNISPYSTAISCDMIRRHHHALQLPGAISAVATKLLCHSWMRRVPVGDVSPGQGSEEIRLVRCCYDCTRCDLSGGRTRPRTLLGSTRLLGSP